MLHHRLAQNELSVGKMSTFFDLQKLKLRRKAPGKTGRLSRKNSDVGNKNKPRRSRSSSEIETKDKPNTTATATATAAIGRTRSHNESSTVVEASYEATKQHANKDLEERAVTLDERSPLLGRKDRLSDAEKGINDNGSGSEHGTENGSAAAAESDDDDENANANADIQEDGDEGEPTYLCGAYL